MVTVRNGSSTEAVERRTNRMMMRSGIRWIVLISLLVVLYGCGVSGTQEVVFAGGQEASSSFSISESSATSQGTSEARGQADYSGTWQGTTSQGKSVSFVIVDNQLDSFVLDGVNLGNHGKEAVADGSFEVTAHLDNPLVIHASFQSETTVTGQLSPADGPGSSQTLNGTKI